MEVVKELVADTMTVKNMQCELANLLENEVYKKEMLTGYDYVAERLGPAGALIPTVQKFYDFLVATLEQTPMK